MHKYVPAAFAAALLVVPALCKASFHFMQIEQAIGGVNGDTSEQAIQLRMRSGGQNQVQLARLMALDAAGLNPILIASFTVPVGNSSGGARVLVVTSNFANQQGLAGDKVVANPIPQSYLAGGALSWESSSGGTPLWLLCWGNYTGPTTVQSTNDADGNVTPCAGSALPSTGLTAMLFSGLATAPSTNNAADYSVPAAAAVFTNNAGASMTLKPPLFVDSFE